MTRRARRERWALGAVVVAFVLSRLVYRLVFGLEQDATTLVQFWQFLDLELLRDDPLGSLFYQHTQPPLFGALVALALQTPQPELTLDVMFVGFGFALHLALYALLRQVGVGRALSVAVAIAWAFNPAAHVYETWVFYTYPVAAGLAVGAACLHRGLTRDDRRWLTAAFLCFAAVCLMRSLFHLVWLGLVIALAAVLVRRRGRLLSAAAIPFLLVVGLYAKNEVVFDRFSASSWLGMSISRLTTLSAPLEVKRRLLREEKVTRLVYTSPWADLRLYPHRFRALPEDLPDHPALTERTRSGGVRNLNHGAYLAIADAFLDDARVMLRESPETYVEQVRVAWTFYVLPCHDYSFFARRRPPFRWLEQVYEVPMGCGQMLWRFGEPLPPLEVRGCWPFLGVMVFLWLFGVTALLRDPRSPTAQVLAFLALTSLYVALVGNLLEVGENNRFRFLTEAYVWVLLAAAVSRGRSWLRRPRSLGSSPR